MAEKQLAELIAERFGVRTAHRINPEVSSVGTSATKILGNNPNRLAAIIVNLGVAALYISPRHDVSTTAGIRLSPQGGTYSMIYEEEFHLVGYDWSAVAEGAGNALFVLEVYSR